MTTELTSEQVRSWIDDDLVAAVEPMTDEYAEFNFVAQMSGLMINVIRQRPGGPILVGQKMEFDEEIRQRIKSLSEADRSELLFQIRQTLLESNIVYGFRNQNDENVGFEDMHHIFLERRIYPDGASQQELMDTLVNVWKVLRYLDDMWGLLETVDSSSLESRQ